MKVLTGFIAEDHTPWVRVIRYHNAYLSTERGETTTMRFGFVIPTYNRADNLMLCLTGLANQSCQDFDVVVWDDGSEDGGATRMVVGEMSRRLPNLVYGWHPHGGYRVSLARNKGARLHRPEVTHYWFVDSDVVLTPGAVDHAYVLCQKKPTVVVCGKYDWLPPMEITPEDIVQRFGQFAAGKLTAKQTNYQPDILGADPRFRTNPELWDCEREVTVIGGSTLSGNLIVPYGWWGKTGGFDEKIEGQGQDSEFGHHLQAVHASVVFCPHVIGYHVSHPIDRAWKTASVRETIKYIHKKYNIPLREENLPK